MVNEAHQFFFDHALFCCYTHFSASFLNLLRSFLKTVNLDLLYIIVQAYLLFAVLEK